MTKQSLGVAANLGAGEVPSSTRLSSPTFSSALGVLDDCKFAKPGILDDCLPSRRPQRGGLFAATDALMTWTSALGIPVLVLAVAVQWWLSRPNRSKRQVLVAACLSFLLSLGFNQVVLLFVQRLRPFEHLVGGSHLYQTPLGADIASRLTMMAPLTFRESTGLVVLTLHPN